jgi:hypothetical protein
LTHTNEIHPLGQSIKMHYHTIDLIQGVEAPRSAWKGARPLTSISDYRTVTLTSEHPLPTDALRPEASRVLPAVVVSYLTKGEVSPSEDSDFGIVYPDGVKRSQPLRHQQKKREKMKKIYVGNLPFDTTEDQLRQLFTDHGTVESANVVTDRQTGRSRGFGFVEMAAADADTAISALNGTALGDRNLNVNEARSRPNDSRSDNRTAF